MKKYNEGTLIYYSKPLSESEDLKCARTLKTIKKVLNNFKLEELNIDDNLNENWKISEGYNKKFRNKDFELTLFLQGSYANDTCVRTESDVDIELILEKPFHVKYVKDKNDSDYGFIPSNFNYNSFKNDLIKYLKTEFGENNVIVNNKSITILETINRKSADIVLCYRYRNYDRINSLNPDKFVNGIDIIAKDGSSVINYPEQHLLNGKEKNKETKRRFKRVVRILKRINYDMQDEGLFKDKISSFGIECCVYNIPNNVFLSKESISDIVKEILLFLINNCKSYSNFVEVNDIYYLFRHDKNKNANEYFKFFKEVNSRL